MVAPDADTLDRADRLLGLLGKLSDSAVRVKTHHGAEALRIKIRGVVIGDVGVRVAGVADHEHLDVPVSRFVKRAALFLEDRAVREQQVRAVHAGAARHRADQEGGIGAVKGNARVARRHNLREQREGAVEELHADALQGSLALFVIAFEQLQLNRRIGSEHGTAREAEEQSVTDVAGGTRNGDADSLI